MSERRPVFFNKVEPGRSGRPEEKERIADISAVIFHLFAYLCDLHEIHRQKTYGGRKNHILDGGGQQDFHEPEKGTEQHLPVVFLRREDRHHRPERVGQVDADENHRRNGQELSRAKSSFRPDTPSAISSRNRIWTTRRRSARWSRKAAPTWSRCSKSTKQVNAQFHGADGRRANDQADRATGRADRSRSITKTAGSSMRRSNGRWTHCAVPTPTSR